ncbi:MAG TPA: universal stress protein [Planctomycetota bacterium]|nr:universal stress protein [Planctomycetota bacterium]
MSSIDRILALTDLSSNAMAGVDLANAVARRLQARVAVGFVHTRADVLREFSRGRESAERLAQWVKEDDEASLRALAERHVDKLRLLSVETCDAANARDGVLDLIRRVKPALVCMATRGRTGVSHMLLGSVAEHTLRTAGVPVMVTKGATMPQVGEPLRMLVAHDLIDDPARLAERASELLAKGDEIIHTHVVESWYYSPSAYGSEFALPQPDVPRLVEAATERLRQIVARPDLKSSVEVTTGRPGEGLVELEKRLAPHVVAAQTHGRRGFDRLMLGSVSEFLARKAKGAVLVFPKAG